MKTLQLKVVFEYKKGKAEMVWSVNLIDQQILFILKTYYQGERRF